ncbi:uncharacterized protein LOC121713601 [Alosa sapidissima]|uniref:uncharacterized protein LOC121713601 n=1 Tax=Alosa sapidissima TaxID=34773 RepID=UPI001C0841CB|nr:uncharacterized protein LOC121713601 [Alosa sapidissima]
MSEMPKIPRLFSDPAEIRDYMAGEISDALLLEARAAMGNPSVSPKKKRRKRAAKKQVYTSRRQKSPRPASASVNPVSEEVQVQLEGIELTASLETRLQELRGTLASEAPVATGDTAWTQRQVLAGVRAKLARPVLLDAKLSAQRTATETCQKCLAEKAVIRCLECVPLDFEYLCGKCDREVHRRHVFHDRVAIFHGYLEPIPPTKAVVMDGNGQPHFCEQVCQLPLPTQRVICGCTEEAEVTTGRHIAVVTMNGRYEMCLPRKVCSTCKKEWTPGVKDLLRYNYWPSTANCLTVYSSDIFEAFSNLKLSAPSFSRHAFLKLLEHQSVQKGRPGKVCADMFQRSYFEYCLCKHTEDTMSEVDPFCCPACQPDMLAVCCDGNRKHYRFQKSKGTEEPSLYEGLFIAKDEDVLAFLKNIRGSSGSRANDSGTCGVSRFKACKEASKKSTSKIDEEGLQVAVCRHGILLRGLNHYRGEIYAYPMFLQKELGERANVTFFCMDVVCRYWPYLSKVVVEFPSLQPLMHMRPFLSVMHAKAHTAKCEVRWGGRNQDGAGNTVGEEVEQVNSFLSRAALVTKYMTKAGRENMITQQAMGWNRKKTVNLHKSLAHRYVAVSERAKVEAASLRDFEEKNKLSQQTVEQWVSDVEQWAVTERVYTPGCMEDLRAEIETLSVTLLRKKQDLYRQHDSNQTRQSKRRKIRDLKKKLKEKVLQYNLSEEDKIDEDLACNLTEGYILPWERHDDGNSFRLKRSLFDQVMLLKRYEEEQIILVKEMSQHIRSLRKEMNRVEKLKDSIRMGDFGDMSEEAAKGFESVLMRRSSELESSCQQAVSTYNAIVDDLRIEDAECWVDSEDEDGFSSPESEEEED